MVAVDDQRDGENSSTNAISINFAIVLLFLFSYPIMLGCAHGSIESPLLVQLPRSGDQISKAVVSLEEFGAKGNGIDDDTLALKSAWDYACSSQLRTNIKFHKRKVYLICPIDLGGDCTSKMTLTISGTIIAPSDPEIWNGRDLRKWIYFYGVNQIVLRGGGTINGMGQSWWARSCKRNATNPCLRAPTAITFHRSKHVVIHDLNVVNSQHMHIALTTCSHVRASRLMVNAPAESPNTDGIHISGSHYVIVENSTIMTGDDCISIVGNSSNVKARSIICGPGHGISIGSLGKSKSFDQIHNIKVENSLISNTGNGARIKTWQGGSGYARQIVFRNIQMSNVSNPIIIDQYYCDSPLPCQNQTSAVKLLDISFIDIKGTSATRAAINISCSDSTPCARIFLQQIDLQLESGGNATAYCWKASGFSSGLVNPPSCLSSADFGIIKQIISSTEVDVS